MSDHNQPPVPPGWYPDGSGNQRWWDGTQWTEHVSEPQQPASSSVPQGGAYASAGGGVSPRTIRVVGGVSAALVLAIVLVVVLVSVAGGSGAQSVAKKFLEAQGSATADLDSCELLTENTQDEFLDAVSFEDGSGADTCDEWLDRSGSDADFYLEGCDMTYGDLRSDQSYQVEIIEVDDDGDQQAVVDYRYEYEFIGDADAYYDCYEFEYFEDSRDGRLLLCKEQGAWKVESTYYDEEYGGDCYGNDPIGYDY